MNVRIGRGALLSAASTLFLISKLCYAPNPPAHLSNHALQFYQSEVALDPNETLEQHRSLYFVIGMRRGDFQQQVEERIETELTSAIRIGDRQRIVDLGRARYHLANPERRRAYNAMLAEQDTAKEMKERLEIIYGLKLTDGNLKDKLSKMIQMERQKEMREGIRSESARHRAMRRLLRDYSGSFLAANPGFLELNAYARALMGTMNIERADGALRTYVYGGSVAGGEVDHSIQRVFDNIVSVAQKHPNLSRSQYQEIFRTWEAVARVDGNYEVSRTRDFHSVPIPSNEWVERYKRYGENGLGLMRSLALDPQTDPIQRFRYLREASFLLPAGDSYELLKDVVKMEAEAAAKGGFNPQYMNLRREHLQEVVHDLILRFPELQPRIEAGASFGNYIASWFSENAHCEYMTAQLAF